MKYEERKAIVKEAYEAGKIAQDVLGQLLLSNLSDEIIEREHEDRSLSDEIYNALMNNEKEENTMKTTNVKIDLSTGIVKFELNGIIYTANPETKRYSKTVDGKTTRIGYVEYSKAHFDLQQSKLDDAAEDDSVSLEEFCDMVTDAEAAQAELDKEPCRVEVENDLYKPAVINQYGCVDCSKCNVEKCVHRNCMRRNPKSEGGLGECPRLDVIPQPEDVDPNDPENAYPDEVQDPELDQIMEETGLEASDAELERNIRNEQKKPSKPRRSKDIAYEGNGVTLTAKQVDFLRELRKTEAYKEDENDMVIEDVTITIGGQFEDKPMTVGAMISTLCEKHLGTRIKAKVGNRTMTLFGLTPSGKDIMDAIK